MHIRPKAAVVVLSALTVFLIVAAVVLLLADLRQRELEHARLETVSIAKMLVQQTDEAFGGIDQMLQSVQERMQTTYGSKISLDSLPVNLLLQTRASGVPQVGSLFLVDTDGNVVNNSREYPTTPVSVRDREYFSRFATGRQSGLLVGNLLRRKSDSSWTIHLAREIRDSDGKFRGVVVASVDLAYFEKRFELMKFDEIRPISLYLADGTLVTGLPLRADEVGERAPDLDQSTFSAADNANTVRSITRTGGERGQQVLAVGRVMRYPLLVSVANNEDDALASWRETAAPIALGAGLVCVFVLVAAVFLIRELSREESLARALIEADDRYLRTINSVTDAIIAVDEALTIRLFNPAAELMFGRPASEAVGTSIECLVPERLRDKLRTQIERATRSGENLPAMAWEVDLTGQRADGSEFPFESTIARTLIGNRPQFTAVLRDVTQRRMAEARQRETNQQLRELSTALQSVREQERTRIAHELHDDLGQQLTGLKLDLSWLSNRLREGRPAPLDTVDEMRHLLDAAIAAVRRISTELRPLILDDLGFGEAVSWQAGELARRSGIQISLELPAAELITDDALATALFRIVQESLTNIIRHANATRAEIRLIVDEGNFVLTILDNGRGIASGAKGGIGLVSMRERATALGGQFSTATNSDGGAVIEVKIPVDQTIVTRSSS